jgi:hypothetical protein
MIYSIAMFFNELDLLDLKIKEESPYVDKILIMEAAITHSGNPKSCNFPIDKYKNNKKVEHVFIKPEAFTDCPGRWDKEERQRNLAMSYLEVADDDILIVTDVDEIINGENIEKIIAETRKHSIVRIGMRLFYYHINVIQPNFQWPHAYAATGRVCKESTLSFLRTGSDRSSGVFHTKFVYIPNCGNHFAWIGGTEKIKEKINNFAHEEFDTPEVQAGVEKRFKNLEDIVGRPWMEALMIVDIDELHPKTIRENIPEWAKYIRNKEM